MIAPILLFLCFLAALSLVREMAHGRLPCTHERYVWMTLLILTVAIAAVSSV